MKILIFLASSLGLLNPLSAAFVTPCSYYFQYELDDSNRVSSGVINLNVTSRLTTSTFLVEAMFGTRDLPVQGHDIPKLDLLTKKSEVMEIIHRNDTLKYKVTFNLDKPIPKLNKIVLYTAYNEEITEKVVCKSAPDMTSRVYLRAFHAFDRANDREEPELKIYTRSEWGAQNSSRPLQPLNTPVSQIFVHFNPHSPDCTSVEECKEALKLTQKVAMDKGFADIPYNYLMGSDGNIYEGVGAQFQANHSYANNHDTIGLAFFGQRPDNGEIGREKFNTFLRLRGYLTSKNYLTENNTYVI